MLLAEPVKHWDGLDRAEAVELRLPRRDRARLGLFVEPHPPRRRDPPHMGSVIGLVTAVAILGLLTWALAPSSPVSPDLMQ